MKTPTRFFGFVILGLVTITSCSKEDLDSLLNFDKNEYSIKSEVSGGETTSKFIYNSSGKIAEKETRYFYFRYVYDSDGRLAKVESAMDPSMLSSTMPIGGMKTELMTSENCRITGYQILEYGLDNKLIRKKNYFDKSGDFEYTSMRSFEYNGDLIVRMNLNNSRDVITQYNTFEYDKNGNVIREKYYSYLFTGTPNPRLISEISYKYDNKSNPFIIFKALGNPGLDTNTNNVIETNSILHEETPGIDKYSSSKTSYIYNLRGYPVKVISGNSEYEYTY